MNTKFLAFVALLTFFTWPAFSKTSGFPSEDILTAIEKAKEYVKKEKIDITGYFIQKVEFKNQYEELVPQYWEVTFTKVPRIKGGYIFIHVYNDGSVKPFYGE